MRICVLAGVVLAGLFGSVGSVLAQDDITYKYDALGRLVCAVYVNDGKIIRYSYDDAGNRSNVNIVNGTSADCYVAEPNNPPISSSSPIYLTSFEVDITFTLWDRVNPGSGYVTDPDGNAMNLDTLIPVYDPFSVVDVDGCTYSDTHCHLTILTPTFGYEALAYEVSDGNGGTYSDFIYINF